MFCFNFLNKCQVNKSHGYKISIIENNHLNIFRKKLLRHCFKIIHGSK